MATSWTLRRSLEPLTENNSASVQTKLAVELLETMMLKLSEPLEENKSRLSMLMKVIQLFILSWKATRA
jgi:hypothetical protein